MFQTCLVLTAVSHAFVNISMPMFIVESSVLLSLVFSLICAAARHSSNQHLIAPHVLIKKTAPCFDKETPALWTIPLISCASDLGCCSRQARWQLPYFFPFSSVSRWATLKTFLFMLNEQVNTRTHTLSKVCQMICVGDYSESLSKRAVSLLLSLCSGHHGNISLLGGGTDPTLNFHWHHSLAGNSEWFLNWTNSQ